jgi:hypothetical protein
MTRRLAVALFALDTLACTLVAERRAGDEPPGVPFEPGDCGIWGRILLDDRVPVDPGEVMLDGQGYMGLAVVHIENRDDLTVVEHVVDSMDVTTDPWYCVPREKMGAIDSGFVMPVFYESLSQYEPEQYYQYRSIVGDPLVSALYIATFYDPEAQYTDATYFHWKDEDGTRFDMPLAVRTSRFEGTARFEGFASLAPRNARLCAYVYGMRDDPEFPIATIGTSGADLDDADIVDGSEIPFVVNITAEPGQPFKVFVHYVENRGLIDDSDLGWCGPQEVFPQSCDMACDTLDIPMGGTVTSAHTWTVRPPGHGCTKDPYDVCPD